MLKPIVWLSLLSCALLSTIISDDGQASTKGSFFQSNSNSLIMDLTINCDPDIDTFYIDADGDVDYEAEYFANPVSTCDSITLTIDPPTIGCSDAYQVPFDVTVTATDTCGNMDQCIVSITLLDTLPPVLVCQKDTVVFTSSSTCEKFVNIPIPVVTDNCQVDTVYNDYSGSNNVSGTFPLDTTTITYFAEDDFGNMDSCTFRVIVRDTISPELTCVNTIMVGLTDPPQNVLMVHNIIMAHSDACGVVSEGIFRMDGGCGSSTTPTDEVILCCDDVGNTVMVGATVSDESGNQTTCMVSVEVSDHLAPYIVYLLPDINISCDFYFTLDSLSVFGSYRTMEADRQDIIIDDEKYDGTNGFAGVDGLVGDNCDADGIVITSTYQDNRVLNQGDIIRTFTIRDESNNQIQVTQTINVMDTDPLTIDDITFPPDTSYNDCTTFNPDPSLTGEPIINNDDICTMPAFQKEDQVFDDPTSGCVFIRRKWTVIDMAQFVPNTDQGRWVDYQYITLVNDVPPTIHSACEDVSVCTANNGCNLANVFLTISATDDCTKEKDLYYRYIIGLENGGEIEGFNDTIQEQVPAGHHTVVWKVEDRCGNISKCEFLLNISECKAPVPVCLNGLSIDLNNMGEALIWAKDFNGGSYDNCTAKNDLTFSFSPNLTDMSLLLTCDEKGDLPVNVYVTDQTGNQSFCSTHILVTDNLTPCPPDIISSNKYAIGGLVSTEDKVAIPKTSVVLSDGSETKRLETNEEGGFLFEALPALKDYELRADKNENCLAGISTLDLVLIQRHILQQEVLSSPYKLLAADINQSKTITASDLVGLRKLILGINDRFDNNDCWLFLDKEFVFQDPAYPWEYEQGIKLPQLDVDLLNSDFIAVKLGDVNGTISNIYGPSLESRSTKVAQLTTRDLVFDAGEEIVVPVRLSRDMDAVALQINFTYDNRVLEFVSLTSDALPMQSSDFVVKNNGSDNHLTVAFANPEALPIKNNTDVIKMKFLAAKSGKLSDVFTENSGILQGAIYDAGLELNYVQFDFSVDELHPIVLSNPSPNPFFDETRLNMTVAYDMPLEISIVDQAGATVFQTYDHYKVGVYPLTIGERILKNRKGVFYLKINGGEISETKQLIRIQ